MYIFGFKVREKREKTKQNGSQYPIIHNNDNNSKGGMLFVYSYIYMQIMYLLPRYIHILMN